MRFTKKIAQSLALLAVVVGGAVAPIAGVVIPGLQQTVAHAADVDDTVFGTCTWNVKAGVLNIRPTDGTSGTLGVGTDDTSWGRRLTVSELQSITKIVIKPGVKANKDSGQLFTTMINVTEIEGSQNLNVSDVTSMKDMFHFDSKLKNINVANWNVAKVEDMRGMFEECNVLEKLDVSNWNTENVSKITSIFSRCYVLKKIDVAGWNTEKITEMSSAFNECSSLLELDLSNWSTKSLTDTGFGMFKDCFKLWKLSLGADFMATGAQYSVGLCISEPQLNTPFNMVYKVDSKLWREKGEGTPSNPTGDEFDATGIGTYHAIANQTETFVWQGTVGDTTVDYTVAPSYTIEIPTGITISSSDKYGSGNVTLGAHPKLPYNQSIITISASSAYWKLTTTGDSTGVAYRFGTTTTGDELSTAGGSFSFTADGTDEAKTQTVYASVPAGSQFKYAGNYNDTVNYTISTTSPPEPR